MAMMFKPQYNTDEEIPVGVYVFDVKVLACQSVDFKIRFDVRDVIKVGETASRKLVNETLANYLLGMGNPARKANMSLSAEGDAVALETWQRLAEFVRTGHQNVMDDKLRSFSRGLLALECYMYYVPDSK